MFEKRFGIQTVEATLPKQNSKKIPKSNFTNILFNRLFHFGMTIIYGHMMLTISDDHMVIWSSYMRFIYDDHI